MRTCSSFRTSFRHIQRLRHARKHSPTVAPRPQMLPMLMTESNDRLPRSPSRKTDFYQYLLSRPTWNAMISTKIIYTLHRSTYESELRKSITVYTQRSIIGILPS